MNFEYISTTQQLSAPEKDKGKKYGKKPELEDTRGDGKIEIDYFRFYESLYRREVTDWQQARAVRRDPFNPITYHIQQLYKDSMLDNHLQGAIENRMLRVLNKDFNINAPDGTIDRERSAQIQTRWFRHLIRKGMESKFYGYSTLFIQNLHLPERSIIDIPRENVIPEKGIIIKNSFDPNSNAIYYGEFPNFFIHAQLGNDSIGILERVAPMTIFKRHSWASWDEFEQVFGLPIRIARTAIQTEQHKDELQKWLELMGTASYAIFDKSTDIEIKENLRTDAYQVFYEKIQAINKEISKGIVGQTMTMDDGSSQSQANVHLEIYNEITTADIQDVQDWITDNVFPVLRYWGFNIPEGYYLTLTDKEIFTPSKKIVIDEVLMRNGYNIKPEYIEEFYGTPLDEKEPRRQNTPLLSVREGIDSKLLDFFP